MPELEQFVGGRYKILQELGSGGFSKTYLAKDTELPNHPLCVVKHLQLRFNSPALWQNAKERFVTEAKVLKRLGSHDCIPQLISYLEEEGEFYLILEFINGEELRQEVNRQVLVEAQVIHFLKETLEILAFVHQQGVIHRDIKPSNLMRRKSDGKIVLIDFGAVKEIGTLSFDAQTQTLVTKAIGTPGYMAPEQLSGKPTYSSDLYALGRTAIYALTGQSPLELEDTRTGELKNWQEFASISPQLAAIINKTIALKLSERYLSVAQVLEDLEPLNAIGSVVGGRYKITRYLRGSNNSQTYQADNLLRHYQSSCLLKQFPIQTRDPKILDDLDGRLDKTIAILEKLNYCPQLPRLCDRFEENNCYYLVQEYIEGENLDLEIQKKQRLSEATVVALMQDVLEILVFVHQQEIIHGNIKPSNLIRRQQDRKFILTDFGAVKEIPILLMDKEHQKNQNNEPQCYQPPEQIAGKPTYSSDLYGLGMVAIAALIGVSPERLQRNPKTGELNWHEMGEESSRLAKILDKMVHLDVSKRYLSASQVLKALGSSNSQLTERRKTLPAFAPRLPNFKYRYILAVVAGIASIIGVWELFFPTWRPMLMVQQGDRLIEQEKPEAAISIFEEAIALNPNHLEAWKGRGDAFFALERYSEALAAYDRALQVQPSDAQAWKGRGDVLYRLERYEAALTAYNKSLSFKASDPETWNRKGRTLYKLERSQEALAAQEEALKLEPNYAEAFSDKGIALVGLGKFAEALDAFNQAQAIKPLDPKLWQNKALALEYLGRRKEAIDVYREALAAYDKEIEQKPDDVTVWVDRGNVLIKLQRPQEALDSYEQALKVKPDLYLAWLSKGNALFPLGRYDEALTAFDKALEIRPESYLTWHNRGSLLRDGLRNFEEAISSYDKALAINRNFYPAWRDRGLALSQANRQQEAISSFDTALKIEANDYQSWLGRGIALSALDRRAEALAAFNKAIEIQPLDPFIWMNKGMALEEWGQWQEALAAYQKARDLDPKLQSAIDALERLQQRQEEGSRL